MQSFSQAGQDLFVYKLLVQPENLLHGTFLDVGACEPVKLSNTYALEQLGWRGLLVDQDPGAIKLLQAERKSQVMQADALIVYWEMIRREVLGVLVHTVDYLSLDVDDSTAEVLRGILKASMRFRVLTVEHDSYRFGNERRDSIREQLHAAGYEIICEDVTNGGMAFEDWWVDPLTVDMAVADQFRCKGRDGKEIVA